MFCIFNHSITLSSLDTKKNVTLHSGEARFAATFLYPVYMYINRERVIKSVCIITCFHCYNSNYLTLPSTPAGNIFIATIELVVTTRK
jgi:hypothetical protein